VSLAISAVLPGVDSGVSTGHAGCRGDLSGDYRNGDLTSNGLSSVDHFGGGLADDTAVFLDVSVTLDVRLSVLGGHPHGGWVLDLKSLESVDHPGADLLGDWLAGLADDLLGLLNDVSLSDQRAHLDVADLDTWLLDNHAWLLENHAWLLENHARLLDNHARLLDNHARLLDNHARMLDNHAWLLNHHHLWLSNCHRNGSLDKTATDVWAASSEHDRLLTGNHDGLLAGDHHGLLTGSHHLATANTGSHADISVGDLSAARVAHALGLTSVAHSTGDKISVLHRFSNFFRVIVY